MAKKKPLLSFRYPYTGDRYTAEGPHRIRVEHGNQWGYFDDCGRWQEGPLRTADPCFCRFLSSTWMVEHDPVTWGLARNKRAGRKGGAPRRTPEKSRASHLGGR